MGISLQFQPFIQIQYCHSLEVWISKIWISGFPKFWEGIFPQLLPSFSRNIVIHWISRTKVDFAFVERQTTLTGAWKCLQFDILAAESTSLQLGTSNFLSLSETNIGLDLKQILIQRGAKIHKPCIPPFRKQGAQMDKVKQGKIKIFDWLNFICDGWECRQTNKRNRKMKEDTKQREKPGKLLHDSCVWKMR